jgi:hypothetical protein
MATVIMKTFKVLTPEEDEARRRRVATIIEEIELSLIMEGEEKANEQAAEYHHNHTAAVGRKDREFPNTLDSNL